MTQIEISKALYFILKGIALNNKFGQSERFDFTLTADKLPEYSPNSTNGSTLDSKEDSLNT